MWRHGDVLIAVVDALPSTAKKRAGAVLAWGEITGHSHRIAAPGTAELWELHGVLYLKVVADTATVMPFWEAATGYVRRPDTPNEDLLDRHNRWPGLWFEPMDEPRSADGGGAIHIAVFVPVGQGKARVDAALAAGGRLVRDRAPMWWTLADEAGNELDIGTLEGRD